MWCSLLEQIGYCGNVEAFAEVKPTGGVPCCFHLHPHGLSSEQREHLCMAQFAGGSMKGAFTQPP